MYTVVYGSKKTNCKNKSDVLVALSKISGVSWFLNPFRQSPHIDKVGVGGLYLDDIVNVPSSKPSEKERLADLKTNQELNSVLFQFGLR